MRHPVRVPLLLLIVSCLAGARAAEAQTARPGAVGITELSRSLEDLAAKVTATVVQIFVTGYAPPDEDDRAAEPAVERSSGSGVIVDPDGYIVTNAHVVENATRLEVELPPAATGGAEGRSVLRRRGRLVGAQVVAVDTETDLAVIKVEAKALPVLPFGDSDALRPGQLVLAFGNPLGLGSSVTMGVVSAVARQLTPEDTMIYVQTDAPINPGNSGGPLVDTEGRLVGINTLLLSQGGGNEGIGFAAPSNIVRNVFAQIRKTGRVRRGEIGILPQTITALMAEALELPVDNGVILGDVLPGGPAQRAGLRPGDIVLALDGKRMENGRQLRINIYTRSIGDQVALEIQRGESRQTIRVPVAERDESAGRLMDLVRPENAIRPLGIIALDLTPRLAALLPSVRRPAGVVVASVSADTPYSQQGRLQPGDVIYALNHTTVGSIADLRAAASALKPSQGAVLQIERQGMLMYLAFRTERP